MNERLEALTLVSFQNDTMIMVLNNLIEKIDVVIATKDTPLILYAFEKIESLKCRRDYFETSYNLFKRILPFKDGLELYLSHYNVYIYVELLEDKEFYNFCVERPEIVKRQIFSFDGYIKNCFENNKSVIQLLEKRHDVIPFWFVTENTNDIQPFLHLPPEYIFNGICFDKSVETVTKYTPFISGAYSAFAGNNVPVFKYLLNIYPEIDVGLCIDCLYHYSSCFDEDEYAELISCLPKQFSVEYFKKALEIERRPKLCCSLLTKYIIDNDDEGVLNILDYVNYDVGYWGPFSSFKVYTVVEDYDPNWLLSSLNIPNLIAKHEAYKKNMRTSLPFVEDINEVVISFIP